MTEYKVEVYEDRTIWRNQDGQVHRLDGPAIEGKGGSKLWYVNGNLHRLDGPAIEYADGEKKWFIKGDYYSERQFNKKIKEMSSSCEGKIVEVDGIKYQLTKI